MKDQMLPANPNGSPQIVIMQRHDLETAFESIAQKYITPRQPETSERLTVRQAGDFIGCCYPVIRKMINEKKVRVNGSGRTRYLLKHELIEDMKRLGQ